MTLQASGPISLNNINVELGIVGTVAVGMTQASVRSLLGISTGAISVGNAYGKSNTVTINLYPANGTRNYNIFNNRGGSYIPGRAIVNVYIQAGFVIGSSSTLLHALDTGTGWAAGDVINIVNSGYIVGMGGGGGGEYAPYLPKAGGPALILRWPVTITNASGYIYSGGGGGSYSASLAGGTSSQPMVTTIGGGGGGAGSEAGAGGQSWESATPSYQSPGYAGTLTNGGNGAYNYGTGGALNVDGTSYQGYRGGGGGGGANGGGGYDEGWNTTGAVAGGGHGLAITRNGNVITWVSGDTRVYGGTA